jgi:prepilin-type N-terminal cleavage/methylation domain-containing protein
MNCRTISRSSRASAARRNTRRGFNLLELLIALTISATLLTATMAALDASYYAYQRTTEVASSHIVSRLMMHRMLTLIRTGNEFGPFPVDPKVAIVESDFIEFRATNGVIVRLAWDQDDEALYLTTDTTGDGDLADEIPYKLLDGVIPTLDEDDEVVKPFKLEYELGRKLYRATINLSVVPDDNMDLAIEGDSAEVLRLVGSALPRSSAY